MQKKKLKNFFYKKNNVEEYHTKNLNIFEKSLKKIIIMLYFVTNILIPIQALLAESKGREIQTYVKSGASFQARQRKAYENSQKERGLKIKRYLINKSALQSKKGKSAAATQKMIESGLVTKEMVKNNRWFVKKGVQTSSSSTSDNEEAKNISRDALNMSKNRARITGPVKPDYLFAESTSRNAFAITKNRARISGPAKPGIIYAEDVGREAMKISKNRAIATGPVKPERLYSEQASRDAKKISFKTAKEYTTDRRDMSVYSEILESMGKRPALNDKPVNVENFNKK